MSTSVSCVVEGLKEAVVGSRKTFNALRALGLQDPEPNMGKRI